MTIMRNPLVVHQVTLPTGVTFVFNSSMGTNQDVGIENLNTDLLVLTQMSCSHMSGGMEKIDAKLDAELSKAIEKNKFTGKDGETVLLDHSGDPSASQRYILLVGLGDLRHFKGITVCGLMRKALEVAKELGVSKMTLPIFPNRQSDQQLNLVGSAAIISCRTASFGDLPHLKEIELFCTPQARRHLQDGILTRAPHCVVCGNPELGEKLD